MEILEQFEYPLPVLSLDIGRLEVETSGSCEGSFMIRNAGGGKLLGRIMSNSRAIQFTPDTFHANEIKIFYHVSPDIYRPGETVQTGAVVVSNGGERIIPLTIRITRPAIVTKEGVKITELKDFFEYAHDFPLPARQLFMSKELLMWLMNIDYPYMEAFDRLKEDPLKERALDNFFILSGLKKKTGIEVSDKKIEVSLKPLQKGMHYGSIMVKKTGSGYVEEDIRTLNGSPWIRLSTDKITSGDFGGGDSMAVNYSIDPVLIKSRYASETIVFSGERGHHTEIIIKKLPILKLRLSKETFGMEDTGKLLVTNHSGGDVMLDILLQDTFIRTEGRRYYVSEFAEIPFDVKVSTFQSAQMAIMKQPYIRTEIGIRATIDGRNVRRTVYLTIGEF